MSQHQNKQVKLQELEPPLPKASLFIWIICIGLLVLLAWAWLFKLEEVSTGTGKVVPSSKEQIIQSLEGGILTKLNVREGEVVQQGQILFRRILDGQLLLFLGNGIVTGSSF